AGWSTTKNGKIINLNTYKVTKDVILYAVWEKGDDIADGRLEVSKKRYVYEGKAIKPTVTVYDRNGKKVSSSQYTVRFEGNDTPGSASILVRGKGKKGGTLRASFYIHYEEQSNVKSAKVSGKNLKVTCSKAKWAGSYWIYAVNKNTGKYFLDISKTTSGTIKNLTKGTYNVYVLPAANCDGIHHTDKGPGNMKTVKIK
ncbi:MAG: hypothetical protein IJ679_09040, partial [Lachnospiraceae bacterium]|nr:hypothetical protein [Lachnospiraceae bacterium]